MPAPLFRGRPAGRPYACISIEISSYPLSPETCHLLFNFLTLQLLLNNHTKYMTQLNTMTPPTM